MRDMYLVHETRVNNVEIVVFLCFIFFSIWKIWLCCLPCLLSSPASKILERTNCCSCTKTLISNIPLGQVWVSLGRVNVIEENCVDAQGYCTTLQSQLLMQISDIMRCMKTKTRWSGLLYIFTVSYVLNNFPVCKNDMCLWSWVLYPGSLASRWRPYYFRHFISISIILLWIWGFRILCFPLSWAVWLVSLPCILTVCVCLVAQSCLTLYHPVDCITPGPAVQGILQARC